MPTYEYLCGACSHNFEVVQSIKADPLLTCPQCDKDELARVLHAVDVLARPEAATLIQQAERNDKKFGRHTLEEKRQGLAKGRKKPKRPWWRKTDKVNTDLAKLAPDVTVEDGKIVKSSPLSNKAKDYIMTGNKQ